MSDFSIDGLIRYFQMAHKVMGWSSTDNSYEYHAAEMLKKLRDERDEARRNLCFAEAADLSFGENGVPYHPSVAHKIAADYGWDCFKEDTDVKSNT